LTYKEVTMSNTALITGASRGLGSALARALAKNGWNLIITARNPDELEAAKTQLETNARVVAIAGDVSDEQHLQNLVAAARGFGSLEAIVNNASTLGASPLPRLEAFPLEVLERVYRVNVFAPLRLIQLAAPLLQHGARVLNLTSDAGVEGYENWGGYGSSKAALEQLSRVLSVEHPQWRVYWVDPGDMRTQMHQDAFPGEDISDRPLPEVSVPGLLRLLEEDLPSGRYQAQKMLEVRA
jgi:NAD(P)-dependent dehydrogenase (short-subunit alcohol dehydrogenase family)